MYLIQKAFHNLFKNKGRNIILFIALFAVILSAVVSLSIFSTADRVMNETKDYYANNVVLRGTSGGSSVQPGVNDYKSFVNSDYLSNYIIYAEIPIMFTSLSKMFDSNYVNKGAEEGATLVPHATNNVALSFTPNAIVIGMLDDKSTEAFSSGQRKIIDGTFPTGNECMISKDLADMNGVKIGDMIAFKIEKTDAECKVSGIYSDTTEAHTSTMWSPENNARNNVIVNYTFFANYSPRTNVITFVLKNNNDIDAFQNELYSKGLSKSFFLQNDNEKYGTAVYPIANMTRLTKTFTAIIFIIGFGVIILINLLALRERRYEIGVFRAIGMSKAKISLLILGEIMILTITAVILAMFAGGIISQPAANWLLSMSQINVIFGFNTFITHVTAGLTIPVVLETLVIAIGIVMIAGLGFIVNILRFDPIKILSDRD